MYVHVYVYYCYWMTVKNLRSSGEKSALFSGSSSYCLSGRYVHSHWTLHGPCESLATFNTHHYAIEMGCWSTCIHVYSFEHLIDIQDLERVVKVLLHKTGESNVFIREDVERTMHEVVQYATPSKLLLAIIASGQRWAELFIKTAIITPNLHVHMYLHLTKSYTRVFTLMPTVIAMFKCGARQLSSLAKQWSTMGHHNNCSMPPEMCWRKHSPPHSILSPMLHLGQGTCTCMCGNRGKTLGVIISGFRNWSILI